MLTTDTFQLSNRDTELVRDCSNRDWPREVLLHQEQRTAYARLANGFRKRRGRVGIATRALTVEQQHLARLLSDGAPEMLLDEMCRKGRGTSASRTSDSRTISQE